MEPSQVLNLEPSHVFDWSHWSYDFVTPVFMGTKRCGKQLLSILHIKDTRCLQHTNCPWLNLVLVRCHWRRIPRSRLVNEYHVLSDVAAFASDHWLVIRLWSHVSVHCLCNW